MISSNICTALARACAQRAPPKGAAEAGLRGGSSGQRLRALALESQTGAQTLVGLLPAAEPPSLLGLSAPFYKRDLRVP